MLKELDEFEDINDNIDMTKKNIIALVDCDSFFVSCEQKMNPELKNKPVCVTSPRGDCVVSRSKEAKKLGIQMGMPYFQTTKHMRQATFIH